MRNSAAKFPPASGSAHRVLSPRSVTLLQHLAALHPLGLAAISPVPSAPGHGKPDMGTMRGLLRRGWARKSICGVFYITSDGRSALKP